MTTFNFYAAALLSVAILATGAYLVWTERQAQAAQTKPLRPLVTLLILVIAILAPAPVSLFFKATIILGLALSLVADAFLATASTPPIIGTAINLVVYLLYFWAFASQTVFELPTPWLLLLLVYVVFWYRLVAPYLREIRVDIWAYMFIVCLMSWQALELAVQIRDLWALAALVAAILLAVADSLRGLVQLRGPAKGDALWGSPLIILGAYILAQWLVAVAVWGSAL